MLSAIGSDDVINWIECVIGVNQTAIVIFCQPVSFYNTIYSDYLSAINLEQVRGQAMPLQPEQSNAIAAASVLQRHLCAYTICLLLRDTDKNPWAYWRQQQGWQNDDAGSGERQVLGSKPTGQCVIYWRMR